MADFAVISIMIVSALAAFGVMARLMLLQKSGLALTLVSLIAAGLAVLIFASSTPIGLDPVRAIAIAMVCLFPALLGAGAGALLGSMILRRRQRNS